MSPVHSFSFRKTTFSKTPIRLLLLGASARLAPVFLFVFLASCPGCASWSGTQATAPVEVKSLQAEEGPMTVEQLTLAVRRFVVSYGAALDQAVDTARNRMSMLEGRLELQEFFVGSMTYLVDIGSGPDPKLNLLDLVVHLTLVRMAFAEYWIPEVYGDEGAGILEVLREGEREAWALAGRVLDSEQQATLYQLIQKWRDQYPDIHYVEALRFGDFASELDDTSRKRSSALLGSIRLAVSEAEEMRLLAERALWKMDRVPYLMQSHAELAFLRFANQPELQTFLTDYSDFVTALDSAAGTFATLPADLEEQREEALKELFEGLAKEREALLGGIAVAAEENREVIVLLRDTLEAGNELARTVDALAARFESTGEEDSDPGKPFDILEYRDTALALTGTAQSLEQALARAEQLLNSQGVQSGAPGLFAAVHETSADAEHFLAYAFRLALILMVVGACLVVGGALLYRRLAIRMTET